MHFSSVFQLNPFFVFSTPSPLYEKFGSAPDYANKMTSHRHIDCVEHTGSFGHAVNNMGR